MTRISNRLLVQPLSELGSIAGVVIVDESRDEEAVVEAMEIPALVAALEYFASLAGSAPAVPAQRPAGEGPDPRVPDRPGQSERGMFINRISDTP